MEIQKLSNLEFIEQYQKELKELPEPIKELLYSFCRLSEGSLDCTYIERFLPAFVNPEAQEIWKELLAVTSAKEDLEAVKTVEVESKEIENASIRFFDSNVTMRAQKIAQVILHMENNIDNVFGQYENIKRRITAGNNFCEKIKLSIDNATIYFSLTYVGKLYINDNIILKNLREAHEAIKTQVQNLQREFGEITKFRTKFMPVTREVNSPTNRGLPRIYVCFLYAAFKRLYGKAYHKKTRTLVQALFPKFQCTEKDITAMVSSLKKGSESLPVYHVFENFISAPIMINSLGLWKPMPES